MPPASYERRRIPLRRGGRPSRPLLQSVDLKHHDSPWPPYSLPGAGSSEAPVSVADGFIVDQTICVGRGGGLSLKGLLADVVAVELGGHGQDNKEHRAHAIVGA